MPLICRAREAVSGSAGRNHLFHLTLVWHNNCFSGKCTITYPRQLTESHNVVFNNERHTPQQGHEIKRPTLKNINTYKFSLRCKQVFCTHPTIGEL